MKKNTFTSIIREEVESIVGEVDHEHIKKELDVLYDKLVKEGAFVLKTRNGTNKQTVEYKVLDLATVSRLTDIKVNHLMLYFIHTQYNTNDDTQKIQLQQRQVYFIKQND